MTEQDGPPMNPEKYFYRTLTNRGDPTSAAWFDDRQFIQDFGEKAFLAYSDFRHLSAHGKSPKKVERLRKVFLDIVKIDPQVFFETGSKTKTIKSVEDLI